MGPPIQISQNPDIRYLGRLLGDVIRAYGGDKLFRQTEYIRSSSVDRHRGIAGAEAIDPGLDALSLDDTIAFVRGFMLFSMLANLAEDRQGVAAEPEATVAAAIEKLRGGRDRRRRDRGAARNAALVAPVLTAHPTEVRRKSVLDHKNRIAELMLLRDAGVDETPEGDVVEEAIRRQIVLLWQTRPLRTEKLFVADEIDNALTYLRDVFLPVVPKLYARWEAELGQRPRASCASAAGSAATATAIPSSPPRRCIWRRDAAPRRCSAIISTRSTDWAPSCRCRRALPRSPEAVEALAEASGDDRAEPARRALSPRTVGYLCAAVRDATPRSSGARRRARRR